MPILRETAQILQMLRVNAKPVRRTEITDLVNEAVSAFDIPISPLKQMEIFRTALDETTGPAALAIMQAIIDLNRDETDPRSHINLMND